MSLLDKAFVKAYTRRHSASPTNANAGTQQHRSDSTVLSSSQQSLAPLAPVPDAVAWIEMPDETYFRVDVGHTQSLRRSPATRVPTSHASVNQPVASSRDGLTSVSGQPTAPTPAHDPRILRSQSLPGQSIPAQPLPGQFRPTQSLPSQSPRVSPTVISHTLTAYELPATNAQPHSPATYPASSYQPATYASAVHQPVVHQPVAHQPVPHQPAQRPIVHEAQVEQARMRIDDSHLLRSHVAQLRTAPRYEEPELFFRGNRDREQAEEFARAKLEALVREEVAKARPPVVAVTAPVVSKPVAIEPVPTEPAPIDSAPITVSSPPVVAAAPTASVASVTPKTRLFEAVWEVDAYEYPETIVELFGDAKQMESIGAPLDHAVANGLQSVLVTSIDRGVGRTSVAIGIAVSAASAGLRVALVDADTLNAGLAKTLRLEIEFGWLEAIQGNVPLEEVAIRSIEDQFMIVPSFANASRQRDIGQEFDQMMSQLRDSFDLIVVDGAAWESTSVALQPSTSIDAAIVVVDARNRDAARLSQIQNDLRRVGVAGLGIVENFA